MGNKLEITTESGGSIDFAVESFEVTIANARCAAIEAIDCRTPDNITLRAKLDIPIKKRRAKILSIDQRN
jgi:hypothetical protein